jgi:hypothetical protein
MQGTVLTAHFLGERTRLVVQVGDDALVKLELPSADTVAPGAAVALDFAPASLMLFGEEKP